MSTLKYPQSKAPIISLLVCSFLPKLGVKLAPSDSGDVAELVNSKGETIKGDLQIAQHLAKSDTSSKVLYGGSVQQIDDWVKYSQSITQAADAEKLAHLCEDLTHHLQMRSFFVGYDFTLADFAIWTALQNHKEWEPLKKIKFPHLMRWHDHLMTFKQFVDVQEQLPKKVSGKTQHGVFAELPDAVMGKVVTRFPPEPSGFLHIGHCKAAMLNNYYAKKYKGKLILRFDDTNPTKEKDEYVENIKLDLKTLGIVPDMVSHTSDHFDTCMKYAEQMIKSGQAFCDGTPVAQMREEKLARIESKYRNNSVEENLRLWNEMIQGSEEGRKHVLRAKIDMSSDNGTLRDPALYRCVLDVPHLRTGTKYKVYPLYDMACPIVDAIEGVTHAMRSNEYHDRDHQYAWLQKAMGLRKVHICDFSRLNFTYQLLSKRKLQWFVDNKLVAGWDDPRFPTIQGLMRRGMTKQALEEFILDQGASKTTNLMDMNNLWSCNKRIIDPIVPRYTAIAKKDAVKLFIEGAPTTPEAASKPRHKKNASLGTKVITHLNVIYLEQEDAKRLKDNEEVTLMDWGNCIITKIHKEGDKITRVDGRLHLAGDFKKTEAKLTWLADIDSLLPVKLVDYGYLITKPSLTKEDKFENFVNPVSIWETEAIGDPNLKLLQKGDLIQLERRGYFRVDVPYFKGQPMILIEIPDGSETGFSSLSVKHTPAAVAGGHNANQKKQPTVAQEEKK